MGGTYLKINLKNINYNMEIIEIKHDTYKHKLHLLKINDKENEHLYKYYFRNYKIENYIITMELEEFQESPFFVLEDISIPNEKNVMYQFNTNEIDKYYQWLIDTELFDYNDPNFISISITNKEVL